MIEINTLNGRQLVAHAAVARIAEAGPSSQWHGIRCYVYLFDGKTLESVDELRVLQQRMLAAS